MARYFDVHPENPQPRTIGKVADMIRDGALIVYPTDSCYAFGCQLGNREGMERIRDIRRLDQRHHFTLVCHDFAQLGQFVQVDNVVFRQVKAATPGSYTFILPASRQVPKIIKTKKDTVGIRVPDNVICQSIVGELGNPLMSTSLPVDKYIEEYTDPEIIHEKFGHLVDIVVNGGTGGMEFSTVIDCTSGEPELVREGLGSWEAIA